MKSLEKLEIQNPKKKKIKSCHKRVVDESVDRTKYLLYSEEICWSEYEEGLSRHKFGSKDRKESWMESSVFYALQSIAGVDVEKRGEERKEFASSSSSSSSSLEAAMKSIIATDVENHNPNVLNQIIKRKVIDMRKCLIPSGK